jgi:hypothetical protein
VGLGSPVHFNRRWRAASGRKGGSVKDDQQPAFPTWKRSEDVSEGMSLRDYFAAAALQGLLADGHNNGSPNCFADSAYVYADAMLKFARSK